VDDVAIFLLHLIWSIEGHHLMRPDQIWRMTLGTPMVRRPAGVHNLKMPWNNNGPGPWGNPGGGQGGGGQGGGGQSGGQGGGGNGEGPPPHGPWGTGGDEPGGNRGGRRGGGGGPFGGGPFGPNGPLPDLEALIRQLQAYIRDILPGGRGMGFGGVTILFAVVVALWFASGFYRVQPDEQGIVLRFGAYKYWTQPGLHWHIPWPVEAVERPAVTRINRTEIGFRSGANARVESGTDSSGRDVLAESLMLTGDENIIDIDVAVFWRIRPNEASKFLFNARNPEELVFGVAESSMREVIGRTPITPALGPLRAQIESDVMKQTQAILDRYDVGIEVTTVQLQKVDPPAAVVESFRDVQRATTDAERMRNEAESYHNDIVPRARGEAARLIAEAQGVKQATIAEANGQSQRFDVVLAAYQQAKDITLRRLYLDAMQNVLAHGHTLVVDDKLKGLVPFLPLTASGGDTPAAAKPAGQPPPGQFPPGQPQPGAPAR
jgi:membrane protease subunit HflK